MLIFGGIGFYVACVDEPSGIKCVNARTMGRVRYVGPQAIALL